MLRKDTNSDFGVDFPDFPGCVTASETLEEAHKRALEPLALHIKGMIEDGDTIPEPSTLDEILGDPCNEDAVPFLVKVPDPKSKRINITLPETELAAIDAFATQRKMTRSAFLLEAAKRAMSDAS